MLAEFSLKRTLRQIAVTANVALTPEQMLKRLFDTENTTAGGVFPDVPHCDDPANLAFINAKAVDCPRREGQLAKSSSMLTPGAPDFFAPVALVNRFDLAPNDRSTCGEYRIIYAKQSGRTDPQNRVFLIFEAALFNSSDSLAACRPAAAAVRSAVSGSSGGLLSERAPKRRARPIAARRSAHPRTHSASVRRR